MTTADMTDLRQAAAFSEGGAGGNPAGALIGDSLPSDAKLQAIAGAAGYSDTALAAPEGVHWRVRYLTPDCEVDFCGHATITVGAVMTELNGPGTYPLQINAGGICVAGRLDDARQSQIELSSPPAHIGPVDAAPLEKALALFGLRGDDLDPQIPPETTNAGNDHLVPALRHRVRLAAIVYDLEAGRLLMEQHGLTIINLIWAEDRRQIHSRNSFSISGVPEDPAIEAAAAFVGYLRDLGWSYTAGIEVTQGADMGMSSKPRDTIPDEAGAPVLVSGTTRTIE
ncbi:PhzF family phenazine biosynthesis protein [Leisingera aquimarina]|uniref:PhzF family phenazine biosynthesis protein n=1 Tax=Leisingera aquimarina TaxID=476529 RepID=UPI001B7FE9A0|nr:PhzF family phenazine biosynthesis isomerase [Leisingera aquimarina]